MMTALRTLLTCVLVSVAVDAFSAPASYKSSGLESTACHGQKSSQEIECTRRQSFQHASASLIAALAVVSINPEISVAAMKSDQKAFTVGKTLTEDEAVARLKEGRVSAQSLLDNYAEICEGGGDNVRRYLGTVGTSSGLWAIGKALKVLADRADDIVEYTELSNEVEKTIQQADGSAYMAIFVSTSSSSTPPSKYFSDAKIEIKRLVTALDELAGLIDVDYSK